MNEIKIVLPAGIYITALIAAIGIPLGLLLVAVSLSTMSDHLLKILQRWAALDNLDRFKDGGQVSETDKFPS